MAVSRRKNVRRMAAEKDNGSPALSYRICQLEGRFAVQADVKQRGINSFESTEQETLADTLERADNAAAGHADDRSHINRPAGVASVRLPTATARVRRTRIDSCQCKN